MKEQEAATPVSKLCHKHGVSDASIYYQWKAKFGRIDLSEAKRPKMMEDDNVMLLTRQAQQHRAEKRKPIFGTGNLKSASSD
ncbi:transposase-like protein [Agrobacterium vitis]|nr:transposase-like protein [Agrobacterium vitis]MBE1439266.1 transposase-like protein [Agrobacterium vitis]